MALSPSSLKPAEYVRNVFAITPEHGVTIDDLKEPEYWAHVAAKLHPTDRVEVTSEDGTWFAEVFVTACARNWAQVSVLRFHELAEATKPAVSNSPKHIVQWKGQNKLHCVIRVSDKAVIKEAFTTAALANAWLADYETKSLV